VLYSVVNACTQRWLPLIDDLIDDTLLQLYVENKIIKLLNY